MFNSVKIHGLYAITPDSENTEQLCKMVEASILGGARVIQYRNKIAQDTLRMTQASALLAVCGKHKIPFIINDHIELCLALDADGVHIGGDDGDTRGIGEIGFTDIARSRACFRDNLVNQGSNGSSGCTAVLIDRYGETCIR